MSDWNLLHGNPAPGNLDEVWATGKFLEKSQMDAQNARAELRALAAGTDGLLWSGLAADATREALGRLAGPHLDVFAASYGLAASAIFTYAESLQTMQDYARKLLVEAEARSSQRPAAVQREVDTKRAVAAATARRDAAVTAVKHLTRQLTTADPTAVAALNTQLQAAQLELSRARIALDAATADHRSAASALSAVDDALAKLVAEADGIRDTMAEAAMRAKTTLDQAAKERVKQPNVISRNIAAIIEVEKDGAAGPEMQEYLDFLGDAKHVIKAVVENVPLLNKTPIAKYAEVAVLGLDIVIMAGHAMQRWAGVSSAPSIWKDLLTTAGDGAEALLTVGTGKTEHTFAGDVKRGWWYDDARKATGGWHEGVHASATFTPEVTNALESAFPGISAASIFKTATVIEGLGKAGDVADGFNSAADMFTAQPPHDASSTWTFVKQGKDIYGSAQTAKELYDVAKLGL